ncbi:relaxase [Amorphus sp. 3PC139-8]|uniref:relaxase/mobilization nuclease domain-containing protein n=1 Tax=Amorphus sp. 3PC139-8 TaxID=2735676 RepID=UPI00345DC4A9
MILVGNQRGGAKDLAVHLLKPENERVEVHELRGFVADDLHGAFQESYAVSRGTKCKQFLFSLSLNPPKGADVDEGQFLDAIGRAEDKLGLSGQPRAVVFHEKRGDDGQVRRHAHAVWSRIDVAEMKAVPLPHSKQKLQDVARDLYLEHGWTMPRGLVVSGQRDPRNFTLEEWQQAKRRGDDPRETKTAFQDAWAISDTKAAFAHALQERGYWLARGDRRGFVAVDHRGEIYAVPKWTGIKTKAVRERLGDPEELQSLADAKREIARAMQDKMEAFQREVAEKEAREREEAQAKRAALRERQNAERKALQEAQRLREQAEEQERQARLRTGWRGLWDRLNGSRKRTLEQNAQEADAAKKRDQTQQRTEQAAQLNQRRTLQAQRREQEQANATTTRSLREDAKVFRQMETEADLERNSRRDAFKERRRSEDRPRRSRQRDGPAPER